jgi:hypothetical protein
MKKYFFYFLIFFVGFSALKATDTEEFIIKVDGNDVTFIHKNLWANCCSLYEMEVSFDEENNKIIITERDTSKDKCHCMCLFDLETTINNLKAGDYTMAIWREELKKYMYPEDKLYQVWAGDFEIEFPANMPPIAINSDQSDCKGMTDVHLEYPLNQSLIASPNPANNDLHLDLQGAKGETAILLVFDISGKAILKQEIKLTDGDNSVNISVKELAQGAYFGIIDIKGEISEFYFNVIK